MFATDTSADIVEVAREVESRGFESLFVPEQTHIPTSRETAYPLGDLPDEYRRVLDPFAALSAAAAVTERIKLGTGVCQVAQHHEINCAKSIATIDHISNGRVVFGIGLGWNVEEMSNHGVDFQDRREVVRERVLAMKALWTQDEASFEGRHVHLAPSWMWPKPVQPAGPPILIGGAAGPKLFEAIVDYADGWIPIGGRRLTENLAQLHTLAEKAGRDPASISVCVYGPQPDRGKLEHFANLGVERVVLWLPPAGRDVILPLLDQYTELLAS
jgi:probable F420-dependent oxidoreductase